MRTLHTTVLSFIGLFLLTQCNSKRDSGNQTAAQSITVATQQESNLNGQWIYSIPFYYSELTLGDDGTFRFHDQGHYGQRFTKGQWTENGKLIILTSFDNFRQNTNKHTSSKSHGQKVKTTSKDGKRDSSYYITKVQAPILPGPKDTILFFFDRVHFKFLLRSGAIKQYNSLLVGGLKIS